jgi:hypothetical protein
MRDHFIPYLLGEAFPGLTLHGIGGYFFEFPDLILGWFDKLDAMLCHDLDSF